MEKFALLNSYYETIVAYDQATQILYIKIGFTNKVYSYSDVTQAMYKVAIQYNENKKALGSLIIYLNDKGSFGKEISDSEVDFNI